MWDYFIGNYRCKLYYSNHFSFLIRTHIKEQFEERLKNMSKECFFSGQCRYCGCDVPALQFANKPCKGNCYDWFISKKKWNIFKQLNNL